MVQCTLKRNNPTLQRGCGCTALNTVMIIISVSSHCLNQSPRERVKRQADMVHTGSSQESETNIRGTKSQRGVKSLPGRRGTGRPGTRSEDHHAHENHAGGCGTRSTSHMHSHTHTHTHTHTHGAKWSEQRPTSDTKKTPTRRDKIKRKKDTV